MEREMPGWGLGFATLAPLPYIQIIVHPYILFTKTQATRFDVDDKVCQQDKTPVRSITRELL